MKQILVTTTNSFEGARIERYIDLVSTNVVVGTNFFSDLGASLTDIFGGNSITYQNKLQGIYKSAIDNLKSEVSYRGGDAIVGLKIDFDEISGKGKSMFMVSAVGMAVTLRRDDSSVQLTDTASNIVDNSQLQKNIISKQIKKDLAAGGIPNKEQWEYLINNYVDDIVSILIENYINIPYTQQLFENYQLITEYLEIVLSKSKRSLITDLLYSKIASNFNCIFPLLQKLKLFSAAHILAFLQKGDVETAIECVSLDREQYDVPELLLMKEIILVFENLPNEGKIETVKSVLSKSKEKFVCACGEKNNIEDEFCKCCQKNIKGLYRKQVSKINDFREKVEVLSELLIDK